MPKVTSTYIPAGQYLSLVQAAEILGLKRSGLQHHISKGHLKTIHFPGLGHIVREDDIILFKAKRRGRPSIYSEEK
jgi:predicted site-specific integrase-resolvase